MKIDFTGKRVLVAGVADDVGFGFAIAKQFAEAGAKVCVAGWPPALGIFETLLRRGKLDGSRKLSDGSLLEFERVYPLDAVYDTLEQAPPAIRENKRYAERGDFSELLRQLATGAWLGEPGKHGGSSLSGRSSPYPPAITGLLLLR